MTDRTRRVGVIGAAGSGKSSVCRSISQLTGGEVVEEAATELFKFLLSPLKTNRNSQFQEILLEAQMYNQVTRVEDARRRRVSLQLFDRLAPDSAVYHPEGLDFVLQRTGMTLEQHYGMVDLLLMLPPWPLICGQVGTAGNIHRQETDLQEIARQDEALRRIYSTHPGYREITTYPEADLQHVIDQCMVYVDELMASEKERKFILLNPPSEIDGWLRLDDIEQYYQVQGDGWEKRYRRMESEDSIVTCYETVKQGSGVSRREWEPVIPEWVYLLSRDQAVGDIIRKRRFTYELPELDEEMTVDFYPGGQAVAEIESFNLDKLLSIDVSRYIGAYSPVEVTGRKEFSNAHLAQFGWPAAV